MRGQLEVLLGTRKQSRKYRLGRVAATGWALIPACASIFRPNIAEHLLDMATASHE
jgi:hypothetical protein